MRTSARCTRRRYQAPLPIRTGSERGDRAGTPAGPCRSTRCSTGARAPHLADHSSGRQRVLLRVPQHEQYVAVGRDRRLEATVAGVPGLGPVPRVRGAVLPRTGRTAFPTIHSTLSPPLSSLPAGDIISVYRPSNSTWSAANPDPSSNSGDTRRSMLGQQRARVMVKLMHPLTLTAVRAAPRHRASAAVSTCVTMNDARRTAWNGPASSA
jgi:hypothetical protein